MSIQFHSSLIFVNDISISKDFYCNLLQQEVENDFGNNVSLKCGISLWQVPDWHYLNKNFYNKNIGNKAFELYFETQDIESICTKLKNSSITIVHDMVEESWGQKTIRVYDPDNNLIEVGESLKTFIKRMFLQGLSEHEIAKKTGVPLEKIKQIVD